MHNFKKLDVWIKSIQFVSDIYRLTNTFPSVERFGLCSQMQRAAVSVPANIAEGTEKSSGKEFARFLEISLGSTFELETELLIAHNLSYIDNFTYEDIQNKISELQKMINGLKSKIQS